MPSAHRQRRMPQREEQPKAPAAPRRACCATRPDACAPRLEGVLLAGVNASCRVPVVCVVAEGEEEREIQLQIPR